MKTIKNIGRTLYKWWMKFAHGLAIANTTILLSLVYFLLIGPMSLMVRLFGKDLLGHRAHKTATFWKTKEPIRHTLEQSRHQF